MNELRQALTDYFLAVDSQKSACALDLSKPIEQLEFFSRNPPADFDPQLRHYLESRSYRKAWTWLEGDTPAKGSCGK
ncbi:MAG: hypothetical protein SH807_10455 [Blastochloris sp.]|nr:hypothetical protein [Blastochloris sp.]